MNKHKICIQCLSDIMPGNGQSVPGIIDNDILVDEYGLPYMHAKTFKGHLREAMELMKYVMPKESRESININRLLGGKKESNGSEDSGEDETGKVKVSEVRLPDTVRIVIKEKIEAGKLNREEVLTSLATIVRSTRINNEGVAEDGSLRSARTVIGGLTFITYLYTEGLSDEEYEFLGNSVRAIQHIGSYKSKGKGSVKCWIVKEEDSKKKSGNTRADSKTYDEESHARATVNGSSTESSAVEETTIAGDPKCSDKNNYILYRIDLKEPVKMGSEGNQNNTDALTYLAGSALRGTIISEILKTGAVGEARNLERNTDNKEFKETLFKETFFYDAYPLLEDQAFLPVPSVYFADKHKKREGEKNQSSYDINCRLEEGRQDGEVSVGQGDYCYFDNNQLKLLEVKKIGNLHIAINESQMFRYEAIAAGQSFLGIIRCKDARTANEYANAIIASADRTEKRMHDGSSKEASDSGSGNTKGKVVYIGGSRGSGYGRCEIHNVRCISEQEMRKKLGLPIRSEADEKKIYNECIGNGNGNVDNNRDNDKKRLTLYALSNLLLLDSYGNEIGKPDKDVLEKELGVKSLTLEKSFISPMRATGFNNYWRAGQVQRTGVKAGSVYVYLYEGNLDMKKLLRLEIEGTGLRRQEGFGRIVFNFDFARDEVLGLKPNLVNVPSDYEDGEADNHKATLQIIEDRLIKKRRERMIQDAAYLCADNASCDKFTENFSLTQTARLYVLLSHITDKIRHTRKEPLAMTVNGGLKNRDAESRENYRLDLVKEAEEKAKKQIQDFRNGLKTKSEKAYKISYLRLSSETEYTDSYSMYKILDMLTDDDTKYSQFDPEYKSFSGNIFSEGKLGQAASISDFCMKCEFLLQTLRYIMRREGGLK